MLLGSLLACQLACETSTSHSTKPDQLKSQGEPVIERCIIEDKLIVSHVPCSMLVYFIV